MNEAATVDHETAPVTSTTAVEAIAGTAVPPAAAADSMQGRSAFYVDVSAAGLVVHTVFEAEDGRLLPLPAVFPDVHYALEQIDALRRLVVERFAQAAQVGAQLIAAQRARAATASPPPTTPAAEGPADPQQQQPAAVTAA